MYKYITFVNTSCGKTLLDITEIHKYVATGINIFYYDNGIKKCGVVLTFPMKIEMCLGENYKHFNETIAHFGYGEILPIALLEENERIEDEISKIELEIQEKRYAIENLKEANNNLKKKLEEIKLNTLKVIYK